VAHYYACKFGLNRLRIDGDIRQKAAITAILENVVIAIYRLRPIQKFADGLMSATSSERIRSSCDVKFLRKQLGNPKLLT